MSQGASTLVVACGALAREILDLQSRYDWTHLELRCVPAQYHSRPEKIAPAVDAILRETAGRYAHRFVGFADCGSGGEVDRVCEAYGVERLPGAHCYEFFAGSAVFDALHEEEIGSFYLTDFMVRHFDSFILKSLGLDRHPELMPMYFGNYRRVVYLAQIDDPALDAEAERCADRLGLPLVRHFTGYGGLKTGLSELPVRVAG